MGRTKTEIKTQITTTFMSNDVMVAIYGFAVGALFQDEFSNVSFENIMFEIVASAIFFHELVFDNHKKEVDDIIEQKFPHRPSWYKFKALAFQYGFPLIIDSDKYDNTGYTDEDIENSKVIKYVAVTTAAGQLLVKIATETGAVLAPVSLAVKAAFEAYMLEIADCGVKFIFINNDPDILLLNIQIFRNPLIMDSTGMSILNGNYPVQDAINEYMKELPFNGELVLAHLVDKLQTTEGVVIPNLINAESQIINISTGLYDSPQPINVKTIPGSGYFTVPNFNNISYVV